MAFRLARVLDLRSRLRERAQDDLARTRAELARVGEAMAAARAAQAASRAAEAVAVELTGATLLRFRSFELAARTRETALEAERGRLAAELATRREALVLRRREERQLELLRERARERDDVCAERATMVLLDDLALRRRGERR